MSELRSVFALLLMLATVLALVPLVAWIEHLP
jgi:hypothetical protein